MKMEMNEITSTGMDRYGEKPLRRGHQLQDIKTETAPVTSGIDSRNGNERNPTSTSTESKSTPNRRARRIQRE